MTKPATSTSRGSRSSPGAGLHLDVDVPGRLRATLSVPPGEVVAVLGPNGAGKSTLLQVVAGLVAHEGTVHVAGEDWTHRPVPQRRLGMVFQDRLLFPHLSAADNVAFGLRARGVGRREARVLAGRWLERVGLGELSRRRPAQLSGGQAQRVALARAMVTDPDVLLLDEPMGSLDVGAAAEVRLELARRLRDFDGVTVVVTHDAVDALTLATTVVVLEDGVVRQVGPPAQVAAAPRTDHVARLVGLNVLRGESRGTRVTLTPPPPGPHPGAHSGAPSGPTGSSGDSYVVTATPAQGPVHVAFPAAAVVVSAQEPQGSTRNRWRGRVRGLTAQETRVRVTVDAQETVGATLLADVTTAAAVELDLAPGREVWLSVKATETTVYAADAPPTSAS